MYTKNRRSGFDRSIYVLEASPVSDVVLNHRRRKGEKHTKMTCQSINTVNKPESNITGNKRNQEELGTPLM